MYLDSGKNRKYIEAPIRVLLAKPAIDGHDRGIFVLARAFRDAGMDVIYAGLLPTPDEVVETAINEDVDVIALSLLNGAHMTAFKNVMEIMKKRGVIDIAVIGGGIIPDEDKPALEKMGISGNFGPGTPLNVIINHVKKRAKEIRKLREDEY
ncbi:cobalamin B12-binding domain-containing protein [Ferroplasma sp.]|uniref:cobalamin B12-binding domain-containing protein n=1 Tax=Ferroplasma sp. TaxID=2591003 RepID=UPI00307F340E